MKQAASKADRPRAQVLIVDDDESMCELLAAELAAHGLESSFETDPARALQTIQSRDVDVVVTDLKMGGISGVELCERIVAVSPNLPVVILTAHGDLESAVAALRVRASDFLTKPPNIDALVAAVDRAVRHRRLADDR